MENKTEKQTIKVEKAISDYFRGLQKKSWAKRKADILEKAKIKK